MTLPFLTPLNQDQMTAAGIVGDWPFGFADQVRFHELDPLNHVNNKVCFSWFETARVRYLKELSFYAGDAKKFRIVVKSVSAEFHKEMLRDEVYIVTARTKSFRNTSFVMEHAIWAGDLRITGEAVVVLLSAESHEKQPIPDPVRAIFESRDGANSA